MVAVTLNDLEMVLPDESASKKVAAKLQEGGYEGFEAKAAMRRIKPGHRVLELGGGLGYITSICARAAGPENVMTVEANPSMIPVIEANLARNNLSGVTLLHGAITDSDGENIPFHAGKAFWGGSLKPDPKRNVEMIDVPQLRFSDLMVEHRPHVVIMDIEGGEEALFDHPWPRHVRAVLIELHPSKYSDAVIARIFDCLRESGLIYDTDTSHGRVVGFKRLRAE